MGVSVIAICMACTSDPCASASGSVCSNTRSCCCSCCCKPSKALQHASPSTSTDEQGSTVNGFTNSMKRCSSSSELCCDPKTRCSSPSEESTVTGAQQPSAHSLPTRRHVHARRANQSIEQLIMKRGVDDDENVSSVRVFLMMMMRDSSAPAAADAAADAWRSRQEAIQQSGFVIDRSL